MNGYTKNDLVKVAIAEDHQLFRQGISVIINTWENHKVTHQASNGQELIDMLHNRSLPDIALIDLQMPVMNGYETIKVLKEKYPDLKTMGFSMFQSEEAVWRVIKCGGQGFLNKTDNESKMKKAIAEMILNGYYFSDHTASKMVRAAIQTGKLIIKNDFTEKEISFLKNICEGKTYKETAMVMNITDRQVEYMRDSLFERFNAKCRTSLAITAMQRGVIV